MSGRSRGSWGMSYEDWRGSVEEESRAAELRRNAAQFFVESRGLKKMEDEKAKILLEQDRLLELVDPNLGSDYSKEDALRMLQVSLLCTNSSHELRPSMSTVVSMLVGQAPVQAPDHDSIEDLEQSTSQKLPSGDSPTCVLKDWQSTVKSDSLCSGEESTSLHLSSTSC